MENGQVTESLTQLFIYTASWLSGLQSPHVKYENIKHFMLQRNNDLILQVNAQVLDNWQNKIRYNLLILYIILKLFIHKLEEKTQSNYIAFAQGNITLLSPFSLCDFGGFNSKPFVWCFEPSGH